MSRDDLLDGREFAVLSDIHGNALALEAALTRIRNASIDRVVILGDLFTYGCNPLEVIDLLESADRDLMMISGNHDEMYPSGGDAYLAGLPDFIRESVRWTRGVLQGRRIALDLAPELEAGPILFAHANPFGFGDWTYMNGGPAIAEAAGTLQARGKRAGVFGHTHRARISIVTADGVVEEHDPAATSIAFDAPFRAAVINAGSVGQPRGTGASMLIARASEQGLECRVEELEYDVDAHVRAILTSEMSALTRKRLADFFRREPTSA